VNEQIGQYQTSAQDMLTHPKEERVKMSLILCHDGNIFGIYGVSPKFPEIYDGFLGQANKNHSDVPDCG